MDLSPRLQAMLDEQAKLVEQERIEKEKKRDEFLKSYQGDDRVVHVVEKLKEIEEDKKHRPSFLANAGEGMSILNETVDGFRKGQLVVLSGPPKNGKSGVCMTLTRNFLIAGYNCLWFQYELSYEEFFAKFPSDINEMQNFKFHCPRQMTSGNLAWIEERIDEATLKGNKPDIIFIDHLDFIKDPESMKEFKYQSANMAYYVGAIVQKCKQMARDKDMVVFLMSHLRKNKWSSNELPTSEDLRDTGRTAQLADIVLMVVRRRNKATGVYDENKAMLGVIENRHNGKTQKIDIELQGKVFVESDRQFDTKVGVSEPSYSETEQITF